MNTYIIAEAGVNHNGDINLAKKLVDIAKESGAQAVKFQTWKTEKVMKRDAPKAEYQINNTGNTETQFEMEKKLELSYEEFIDLKEHCDYKEIDFLSTPFDIPSAEFLLEELNLKTIKVSSGEITNAPLLYAIAKKKPRIILSTGMATLSDIQLALGVIAFGLINNRLKTPCIKEFENAYISKEGQSLLKKNVSLLHCTTEYPAPLDSVNLNAIPTLKSTFGLDTGYSDHTQGNHVALAAVALGATIIEKHITYDRHADGPDHIASIEPNELNELVKNIGAIEMALGNKIKIPTSIELKNRIIARKSLVAAKRIEKGEQFSQLNLDAKRPGTGISPMYYWDIQKLIANKTFDYDEEIHLNDCFNK